MRYSCYMGSSSCYMGHYCEAAFLMCQTEVSMSSGHVRNTHGQTFKQTSLFFSRSSKYSSRSCPCWSGVWQCHTSMTNLYTLSELELLFSHSPFCGWFSTAVVTRGIFLTFKIRKKRQKASFHKASTFQSEGRAFSASFHSFHWPNPVPSHTHGCYHIMCAYINVKTIQV